jgi:hypothetical protein
MSAIFLFMFLCYVLPLTVAPWFLPKHFFLVPVPTVFTDELWPVSNYIFSETMINGQFYTFMHFRLTYIISLKIASVVIANVSKIYNEIFADDPAVTVSSDKKND